MSNAALPPGSPLDPLGLIEMAVSAEGIAAPLVGWVMQDDLAQGWAVVLRAVDSPQFYVWGRTPGDQATAVLLWGGDSTASGSRLLREDGSPMLRENGDFFRAEAGTP